MRNQRCGALDVHGKNVVACVLMGEGKQVGTFGTVTKELLRVPDWLREERITHLAIEGAGVYWRPLYSLLEGHGIELMVVNPDHMKAVPGRKTDIKDAEWITGFSMVRSEAAVFQSGRSESCKKRSAAGGR